MSRFLFEHKNTLSMRKEIPVEVVNLSPKEYEKIRKQIVQTQLVKPSEKAAEDAFLGKQTQVVDRQTRAKNVDRFKQARPARLADVGQKSNQTKAAPKKLSDLGVHMNFKPLGNIDPNKRNEPGQESASNDHVNLDEGAQALLNTKEFKYYTFYQRIRQQLEQFWEPGLRERMKKMFAKGRALAADKDHSTKLVVVLNDRGVITRILVENTSGVGDLDQAAIDAFNRAGPFPNPPQGLLESDRTVKISWEFVLRT